MSADDKVEPSEELPSGDLAVIGEQEISLQVLQDVYNEVTGKAEELNKFYETAFRVRMEDLQQLHYQVKQLCEQYNVKSENESVTIFYEEDSREVFSSFDRFKISGSTSLSPVESIVIKYNFLVVLPKSRRPQSYSLSIRLASRVTLSHKMRREVPRSFFRIMEMGGRNATVTVKYVDYVVARNLLGGVDRWINGLPAYEFPKWFTFIRRYSEHVRHTLMYALGAFGAYLYLSLVPEYVPRHAPDFQVLSYFAILGSLSIFGLFRLGRYLGSQVELALDESQAISYIQLNRGDEKRIQKAHHQIWWNLARGVFGVGGSVILGVISSYIVNWLET
jgi:hypothetical protein